jgi:hypothetical protein
LAGEGEAKGEEEEGIGAKKGGEGELLSVFKRFD